jgi:hypothetical protein
MDAKVSRVNIERILQGFLGSKCSCILGAGASAQRVPLGSAMNDAASQIVLLNPTLITPGLQGRAGLGRNWIIRPPKYEGSSAMLYEIGQLSPQQLRVIEHEVSKPRDVDGCPSAYEVFRYVPNRLTLLNYNVDKLATRYCGRQHVVREMHGTNDPRFPYGWDFGKVFDMAGTGYNVLPPSYRGHFEPERPDEFGYRWELWWADALIGCTDIIIIGYSFARQKHGGLNDWLSLQRIRTYLRDQEIRITVVDLNPSEIVEQLREELRNTDILGTTCYWDKLADAIIEVSKTTIEGDIRGAIKHCDEITRQYYRLAEHSRRLWYYPFLR